MTRRLHRRPSPRAIALWRYERIEEPLGIRSPRVRGRVIRAISCSPVVWPSGTTRCPALATLYRWICLYSKGGLKALQPARRKDAGKPKARLPSDVVRMALALLAGDPDASLSFIIALLYADPALDLRGRSIRVSRSTLQRRLAASPAYAQLKRARKLQRERCRFVGRHLHDIWHLDAKGPVTIRLVGSESISFHVLTILEGLSRAVLAAVIVLSPDLCAAVRVFRCAALKWGLPDRIYVDRASIFDSVAFRAGLATLGVHRIAIRSRNPPANGKIEAYHRVLSSWFTKRLKRQQVVDLEHLQQLLEAFVEVLYQDHRHRGLRSTPRQELGNTVSSRQVPVSQLEEAFRQEHSLKAHSKTGEIDLPSGTWLVPKHLRGQRLTFLVHSEPHVTPLVVEPGTERHLPLQRAAIRAGDLPNEPPPISRWGQGPLQALYDSWQGKVRPIAEPGFGLPEIFSLLAEAVGRPVPRSDDEAALIQRAYSALGPLPRDPTLAALRSIRRALGDGRPIKAYLDALAQRVLPAQQFPEKHRRK
jgi:transposase InsO family protein